MTPGRLTFLRSLHTINRVRHKSMKWQADILALFACLEYVSKAHLVIAGTQTMHCNAAKMQLQDKEQQFN